MSDGLGDGLEIQIDSMDSLFGHRLRWFDR